MSHIVTLVIVIVLIYSMVPQIYMGPTQKKLVFQTSCPYHHRFTLCISCGGISIP